MAATICVGPSRNFELAETASAGGWGALVAASREKVRFRRARTGGIDAGDNIAREASPREPARKDEARRPRRAVSITGPARV